MKEQEPIVPETLKEEVVDEMAEQPLCIEESEEKDSNGVALALVNDGAKGKKSMKKRLERPQSERRFTRSALKEGQRRFNKKKKKKKRKAFASS